MNKIIKHILNAKFFESCHCCTSTPLTMHVDYKIILASP